MANPPQEEDFAVFVAIDWADQKHAWALGKAGSPQREQGEMEATPEAVAVWINELRARFPGQRMAVALEQKRGALLYLLRRYAELVLYPVHPATAEPHAGCAVSFLQQRRSQDADLLLDILLHHRKHLRRLDADTIETRKLQMWVEDRRNLVDQQTAHTHQLRARLKLYFPQAVRWLPELDAPLAAAFLKRWPTLPLLQKARLKTIRSFFHRHNCRSEALLEQRLREIPAAVVATEDAAIVDRGTALVRALLDLIGVLRTHIAALDQLIAATAAVHPELPIVASLPGAGSAMEPRLIAALGTQRERFAEAGELQSSGGIGPVQQRSGQSEWIHFRWACPKFLRQTFHEWAGHSIAQSRWAKAYYDAQIAKHKGHHAAVRSLAFKWQRILFRCWKDHQPYDEHKYIEALRRRGSPLAQALS